MPCMVSVTIDEIGIYYGYGVYVRGSLHHDVSRVQVSH